jgi:predicted PurR-regulated permease PerM
MAYMKPQRTHTLFWIGVGIAILAVIYILSPILTPFLMAAILAFILRPGVDWLARKRCPRAIAALAMVTLLFLIVVVLVLVLVPLVQREIVHVQEKLPGWIQKLNLVVAPKLLEWFGVQVSFDGSTVRQFISDQVSNAGEDAFTTLMAWFKIGAGTIAAFLGNLLLVPVVLFYLLLDWHNILARLKQLVPLRYEERVTAMAVEIDQLLGQWLRGQLSVMGLLAVFYSIGLALVGLEAAIPIGVLTGLLAFIPYLGFGLGLVLALLLALLQYSSLVGVLGVAAVYAVGQAVESFVFTPYLVGERIGLHPLTVIFALMAFGQVFGFFGVLLALPMCAILMVGLRRLTSQYHASDFYRR